jgi:serine/threonine-protein kinase
MELDKGKTLKGRYRILEKIGTGGMADVYLAYDIVLDRKVAVKVMHSNLAADESFVKRFKREAQAAANLNHPNIVSVYDWGYEEGTYFIVMEYITGKTLKQLIKEKGPLPIDFGLEIAKQIASALSFAHRHEVIHRDIKPHNIIITEDGHVKVTDFGIARAKSGSITETGSVMGSVHYLSPEQSQGLPATELSDIYSFGCLLYEMFTGSVPFDGESAVSIAMKHATEKPASPSSLNALIPPELEAVILKAMAKDPFDRYQTADEILSDLKKLEAGKPVEAQKGSYDKTIVIKKPLLERKKKRSWVATILLPLFLILIAAGIAGGFWYYQSIQSAKFTTVPKIIDLDFERAEKLLEEKGLKIEVVKEEYSATYDKGKIIRQDPPPGTRIEKGTPVKVVVSLGEKPVKVPELIGKTEIEAGQILGELGLRIGEIKEEYSDKAPEGVIISQKPAPGTEVKKGTAVDIVISKGIEVVIVPDVTGLSANQAKTLIEKAKLKVKVIEEESETVEKGKVIRQSPSAGDTAKKGDEVIIVVSAGPAVVTVPNVVGLDSLSARNQLENLGLEVVIENVEVLDEAQVGKVVQQSPDAGAKVFKNSTVTIWVGQ